MDGIRGLAILLVLVLHYFVEITPGRYVVFFRLAWSGVDLFFVLSGFLIAGILLDAKDSRSYYKTFYLRRFHRIVPLYAIWLLLFLVGIYAIPAGILRETFNASLPLWTYFVFLQNFWMASHGNFGSVWMGITWSLAVEEQFYLLLPWLIRRLSRKSILMFTVTTIVGSVALRIYLQLAGANAIAVYVLLPCRADSLGLGVLVALAYRSPALWTWITAHRGYFYLPLAIFGCGIALWTLRGFQIMGLIGFTWMAAFYALLLVLVLAKPGPLERAVFGSRVLTRLGTIAYAVYLFHSGILRLYHYVFFRAEPLVNSTATFLVTLLSLMTTLALAELSWKYLEKPMIQRGRSRYRYG